MGQGEVRWHEWVCGPKYGKLKLNFEYVLDIQPVRLPEGLASVQLASCSGIS